MTNYVSHKRNLDVTASVVIVFYDLFFTGILTLEINRTTDSLTPSAGVHSSFSRLQMVPAGQQCQWSSQQTASASGQQR